MILYLLFDVWPSIKLFRIYCAIILTIFFDFNFEAVYFRFCSTKNNRAIYRFKIKIWSLKWKDQDFRWRTKIQDYRNCILSFLILTKIKFCMEIWSIKPKSDRFILHKFIKYLIKTPKSLNWRSKTRACDALKPKQAISMKF